VTLRNTYFRVLWVRLQALLSSDLRNGEGNWKKTR
jgi:hypothetical protein